jgi:hypothetical protein
MGNININASVTGRQSCCRMPRPAKDMVKHISSHLDYVIDVSERQLRQDPQTGRAFREQGPWATRKGDPSLGRPGRFLWRHSSSSFPFFSFFLRFQIYVLSGCDRARHHVRRHLLLAALVGSKTSENDAPRLFLMARWKWGPGPRWPVTNILSVRLDPPREE